MYRAMHMRRAVKMFGVDSRAMSAAVVDLAETNSLSRSNHLICLRALRNELPWRDREVRRCACQLSHRGFVLIPNTIVNSLTGSAGRAMQNILITQRTLSAPPIYGLRALAADAVYGRHLKDCPCK